MLLRGYLGSLGRRRVLGRWKDTEYRVLRDECPCAPCSAAFFAALALLSFGVEPSVINRKHRRCNVVQRETDSWQPPCPWWILSWPLVESVMERKGMSMGSPESQDRRRPQDPLVSTIQPRPTHKCTSVIHPQHNPSIQPILPRPPKSSVHSSTHSPATIQT